MKAREGVIFIQLVAIWIC